MYYPWTSLIWLDSSCFFLFYRLIWADSRCFFPLYRYTLVSRKQAAQLPKQPGKAFKVGYLNGLWNTFQAVQMWRQWESWSRHVVPQDPQLWKVYLQLIGLPLSDSRKFICVCGWHFSPKAYTINPQLVQTVGFRRRQLRLDAVPTSAYRAGKNFQLSSVTKQIIGFSLL